MTAVNHNHTIPVCFIADPNMTPGLHVAINSMMEATTASINLYVFQEKISKSELNLIEKTFRKHTNAKVFKVQAVRSSDFTELRGLHGSQMPWVKLLLPSMVPEDRFIYLDADTVVKVDISELFNADLRGCALGAVCGGGTVKFSIEKDFLMKLGLRENDAYFNSGVLIFDRKKWIALDLSARCIDFAKRYGDALRSADQAALNAVLADIGFSDLPSQYNIHLQPNAVPPKILAGIFHFVGSPKPWDPGAKWLHLSYELFALELAKTEWRHAPFRLSDLFPSSRTVRILRSYFRAFQRRRRGGLQ